jgi:hypothetical protein
MRLLQKRELSQRAAAPSQVFDNNQPTMVTKDVMARKEKRPSTTQSCALVENATAPTSKKKSCQQPPPASRHRSVLTLDRVVSLFDMRANMSNNIDDIIRSSRDARPIQRLTTITTNRISQVEDPRYVELLVSFYSPPEEESNCCIKNDFKVIMPSTWTPKMYLGALHQSIRTNSLLTLKSIEVSGRNYTTMNELNWLFLIKKEVLYWKLATSASYLHLHGGEFQSKIVKPL